MKIELIASYIYCKPIDSGATLPGKEEAQHTIELSQDCYERVVTITAPRSKSCLGLDSLVPRYSVTLLGDQLVHYMFYL